MCGPQVRVSCCPFSFTTKVLQTPPENLLLLLPGASAPFLACPPVFQYFPDRGAPQVPTALERKLLLMFLPQPSDKGAPLTPSPHGQLQREASYSLFPKGRGVALLLIRQDICWPTYPWVGSLSHRSAREFHPVSLLCSLPRGWRAQPGFFFWLPVPLW